MQTEFPRVKAVSPLDGKRLLVTFANDQTMVYDCTPLLDQAAFRLLRDEPFFRSVQVEPDGYAIAWDERVDLAESELWLHGEPVESLPGPGASSKLVASKAV